MKNEKWIPMNSELYPEEKTKVQITYVGLDNKMYCDGFAYRIGGSWFWADGEDVTVEIVAWKYNCEPYSPEKKKGKIYGTQKSKDIKNQRFGSLVATEETALRKNGSIVWKCWCDCGKIVYVPRKYLLNNHTRSCGCLKYNTNKQNKTQTLDLTKHNIEKEIIKNAIDKINDFDKKLGQILTEELMCGNTRYLLPNGIIELFDLCVTEREFEIVNYVLKLLCNLSIESLIDLINERDLDFEYYWDFD